MKRHVPPLMVIAVAVATWVCAAYVGRRDAEVLSIPFDARAGAVMSAAFKANHDAFYDVGLTLDRPAADRAFPCFFRFSPPGTCKDDTPIDLIATVSAGGRVLTQDRYPNESRHMRGTGHEDMTIVVATTPKLVRGQVYRVEMRSAIATGRLAPARPRLTVVAQALDLKEEMLLRSLVATAAGALGLIGAAWLVVVLVLNRRYLLSR